MAPAPQYDVVIVGGGPGGLHAGRCLAREGFHVALFEEHRDIGSPVHCTGVLADEAFSEFDVPRESVLNELHTARFYSPSGQSIEYTTQRVEAIVIDRRQFDHVLGEQAVAAGLEVHRGHRVSDLQTGPGGVRLTLAGGPDVRGRVAVLACGANYKFQQRLGMGLPHVFLQTAQLELPCERLGDVELHFGGDIAPKGFAWAVPVRRARPHVRVGVMANCGAIRHFHQMLWRLSTRWGVRPDPSLQPRQKLLPLASIGRTYAERVIAIGDAAGLVKPTTGGGIYYSMLSADLASEVLAELLRADDLGIEALAAYESRWRKRLAPELSAQLSLRQLAQKLTDAEIEGLFDLARTNGVMPIVRSTARFNQHRGLILALFKHPPARRLLFRRLVG